jgi:RND family efflux transporter MFP subunit
MNVLRTVLQFLLPIGVLAGAWALARAIAGSTPPPVVVAAPAAPPAVRVVVAAATDERLDVTAQGTVEPLRTADLSSEVAGRIVRTADALRAGGAFAAGDVLVVIDPTDFDFAIRDQEAAVARAELRLQQERAEAAAAVRAWKALEGEAAAEPLVTRAPQIREAEAALAASHAMLDKRRLDRARTEVKAPFAGRVRSVAADLGQIVQAGQRLAVIFDDTTVEVRLPVPANALAWLELPWRDELPAGTGPLVDVTADFAGARRSFRGHVVRTEGEVDRRTRQLTVVARIAAARTADGPPLLVGQFVHAVIHGRTFPAAIAVPSSSLHEGATVWVVGADRRLARRAVDVLRAEPDRVLLRGGLAVGEHVVIGTRATFADGLEVTVVDPATEAGK